MKMPTYSSEADTSNRSEFDVARRKEGSLKMSSTSAERATKSVSQKLCRSTCQKNLVIRYGYNEYMGHDYLYMAKVAEMREPESCAEATEDANWRKAMEEEMRALLQNETWDLVDTPKGVKPIRCKWVYKVKYNNDCSIKRYKV